VLTTRWAMSYLRGPLTRDQIAVLTADDPRRATPPSAPQAAAAATSADESPVAPEVAAGVGVSYLDVAAPWAAGIGAKAGRRHEAAAVARIALRFDEEKAELVADEEYEAVLSPLPDRADPAAATDADYDDRDLLAEAPAGAVYVLPSAPIKEKRFWADLERAWTDHLARNRMMELLVNREVKLYSRVGETHDQFVARCQDAGAAKADEAAARLRDKYETRLDRIQAQLATAQDRADVLATQQQGRQTEELLGTAGSILGTFLGGRRSASKILSSLGTAAGRRTRSSTTGQRLEAARNKVADLAADYQELEAELAEDLTEITDSWSAKAAKIEALPVRLERTDVRLVDLRLVWVPVGPVG
jgi:hypothetical protein